MVLLYFKQEVFFDIKQAPAAEIVEALLLGHQLNELVGNAQPIFRRQLPERTVR